MSIRTCFDSGDSSHLCSNRNLFTTFEEHQEEISLAGNKTILANGKGRVLINEGDVVLNDVLFVPDTQCNFISVGKVAVKDDVIFGEKYARIISKVKTVLKAMRVGNMFLYNEPNKNLLLSKTKTNVIKPRYGCQKGKSPQNRAEDRRNNWNAFRHIKTITSCRCQKVENLQNRAHNKTNVFRKTNRHPVGTTFMEHL